MVRLKVLSFFEFFKDFATFQFHYGSIKGYKKQRFPYIKSNFNSTMVRLKDKTGHTRMSPWIFQFHYGSIKGKELVCPHVYQVLFQFHYGSIKGRGNNR